MHIESKFRYRCLALPIYRSHFIEEHGAVLIPLSGVVDVSGEYFCHLKKAKR